jgi:MOSC domain-containing protein YiiM
MANDANAAPDGARSTGRTLGRVVALYVAPSAGEPVRSPEAVQLVAGVGIVGDRYTTRTGHWSDDRWPDQQLTLVQEEVADELGLSPELLRRNVVTRGVSLAELIGVRFRIGDVAVQGVRTCDPCAYLERLVGRAGLASELGRAGPGLRAAVLTDGRITVGDPVS